MYNKYQALSHSALKNFKSFELDEIKPVPYVALGINAYSFCFSKPKVCVLIAQSTLFTQSHYNNLFFCLHQFNPFAKQTTQYRITYKIVLHTDTMLQNSTKIEFFIRFSKNDHCNIVRFRIAFTVMQGQITP